MKTQIAFRLDNDLYSRLEALSKKTGRKKTFYFRTCLEKYLSVCEAVYIRQEEAEKTNRKKKIENIKKEKKKDL